MIAKIYPNKHPDLKTSHPVKYFDIRKFTERECLRLMDVSETDISILTNSPKLSKSSIYIMAGNSIVVSCIYNIFKNIYEGDEDSHERGLFTTPTFKYPPPSQINMVTLCSGYDSQVMAMERLVSDLRSKGVNTSLNLAAWSEFDPDSKKQINEQPAVIAHNLLYPQWRERNLGDMTKINWEEVVSTNMVRNIDILTYSTPCQSISQSGKREGLKKGSGTRSSILWNTEAAIRALKPKFLLQENVKALCNKRNLPDFLEWQKVCNDLGYDNYWQVMNAKDYGMAQNRERVFMLSVRRDLGLPAYTFPKPQMLQKDVCDYLDDIDDKSYFLSANNVVKFLQINETETNGNFIYVETDHKLTQEEITKYRNKYGKSNLS